jgi:hypothetical protein
MKTKKKTAKRSRFNWTNWLSHAKNVAHRLILQAGRGRPG